MRFLMSTLLTVSLLVQVLPISRAQPDSFDCPFASDSADCYLITVADGIQVAVAVFPAYDEAAAEPLVMVEGGPGGSTLEQFGAIMDEPAFSQPFRQQHNIILIDLRGTYHSQPSLVCPDVLAAELAAFGQAEDAEETVNAALQACYDRIVSEGIDPAAFNSLSNVQDVLTVVDTLGYNQFHYYGVSYGAMLGLHLMQKHPDRLASAILDSVIPLDAKFISGAWRNYIEAREQFFAACLSAAACASAYPNLVEDFAALAETLRETPQRIDTGQLSLYVDDVFLHAYLQQSLYITELLPYLPLLITLMAAGEPLWITEFANDLLIESTFASGVFYATICAEELQSQPPSEVTAENVIGQGFIAGCEVWQVPSLPGFTNLPVPAEVPTLMFAGQFDPIAPPFFLQEASEWHKNDYSYTVPATGHGVIIQPCVRQMMGDFLSDPTTAPDSTCLDTLHLEFFVEDN